MGVRAAEGRAVLEAGVVALCGGLLGTVADPLPLGAALAVLAAARVLAGRSGGGAPRDPGTLGLALAGAPAADVADETPNLAVVDALTGAANRRGAERALDAACRQAAHGGGSAGVVVLGIRDFALLRQVNGAEAAREALRHTARCLRTALGPAAVVGRWAGEEFVCVLPGVHPSGLPLIAERLRTLVESQAVLLPGGGRFAVRASVGCAAAPRDGGSPLLLIAAARGRGTGSPARVLAAA